MRPPRTQPGLLTIALLTASAGVLAHCSVGDIDLTGRACPCATPYVCDSSTNVCVADLGVGAGGGGSPIGGAGGLEAGGSGGVGAHGGGGGTGAAGGGLELVFEDEFDGDMSAWEVFGGGTWEVAGGEMHQTDPSASSTFVHAPALAALTDYRIESRMRQVSGSVGGAMELVFRTDVDVPQYYYCNIEPNSGEFLLMGTDESDPIGYTIDSLTVDLGAIAGYDPMMSLTMVVEVRATQIHCHVEELAGATLTVFKADLPTYGSAGMKVWSMVTAWDYFRVYSLAP